MCADQRTACRSQLSFHCVGPRDQTRVFRLGSKHLYPLSPLAGPGEAFFEDSFWSCLIKRTGEMARWLRALAALPKDLGLIPSNPQ